MTSGSLRLDHGNALGRSTFAGGAGGFGFGNAVTSATFGGLAGSTNLALSNTGGSAVALTVGANNASTTYSGVLSGNGGAVTKVGTGTFTLGSANTYTGNTTITAGVLKLGASGAFDSSPTVVVGDAGSSGVVLDLIDKGASFSFGSSQTLKGKGTIRGRSNPGGLALTVSGTLSPGNSPDTLSFDNTALTLGSTSYTLMEITGTGYDIVSISGAALDGTTALTYGGTMVIDFGAFKAADFATFNLFQVFNGTIGSGSFSTIVATGSFYSGTFSSGTGFGQYVLQGTGQSLQFTQSVSDGGVTYGQLIVVPEPLMLSLLGIAAGVGTMAIRRARRRRTAAAEAGDFPTAG